MHLAHETAAARGWRALLCIAASLAAIASAAITANTASADCTTGGSGCLPGSGYTFDSQWNCGTIGSGVDCTSPDGSRSWGWGSAAYNAGGVNVNVCVYGGTAFGGCGTNLIRACYFANCNDQNSQFFSMIVENFTGSYVIHGHAQT